MPWRKDHPAKLVCIRGRIRTDRHGNWRQTFIDCAGMCQARMPSGEICGATDLLEFREPFGEYKNHRDGNQSKLQLRVLLCFNCHKAYHHGTAHLNERRYAPKLQEDVAYEIARAGNIKAWMKKYNLLDRYSPFVMPTIPVDYLPANEDFSGDEGQ